MLATRRLLAYFLVMIFSDNDIHHQVCCFQFFSVLSYCNRAHRLYGRIMLDQFFYREEELLNWPYSNSHIRLLYSDEIVQIAMRKLYTRSSATAEGPCDALC